METWILSLERLFCCFENWIFFGTNINGDNDLWNFKVINNQSKFTSFNQSKLTTLFSSVMSFYKIL